MEYREIFESLASAFERFPDDLLMTNFLTGLEIDTCVAVRLHKPRDLLEVMELAQLVEEANYKPSYNPNPYGGHQRDIQPPQHQRPTQPEQTRQRLTQPVQRRRDTN